MFARGLRETDGVRKYLLAQCSANIYAPVSVLERAVTVQPISKHTSTRSSFSPPLAVTNRSLSSAFLDTNWWNLTDSTYLSLNSKRGEKTTINRLPWRPFKMRSVAPRLVNIISETFWNTEAGVGSLINDGTKPYPHFLYQHHPNNHHHTHPLSHTQVHIHTQLCSTKHWLQSPVLLLPRKPLTYMNDELQYTMQVLCRNNIPC